MRNIVILFLVVVAIALARMLVGDIAKAVKRTMASPEPDEGKPDPRPASSGRLVKDPETGAYVDEAAALKVEIDGKTYYFESETSRDAFLRKH